MILFAPRFVRKICEEHCLLPPPNGTFNSNPRPSFAGIVRCVLAISHRYVASLEQMCAIDVHGASVVGYGHLCRPHGTVSRAGGLMPWTSDHDVQGLLLQFVERGILYYGTTSDKNRNQMPT